MELIVKLDFWFDGIDESTEEEIKHYLQELLISGAEATCSEVTLNYVMNEDGTL